MISEKVELLGKGLYTSIPDQLTLHSLPTISELDYVGSEDFDKTMIDKILPSAIEEKIDCKDLLEIDYYWLCRCLRILNYGPYYTTNLILCRDCGQRSDGDYRVNLNTVECIPLPEGFKNDIVVSRDDLIDYDGDITLQLLTMKEVLTAYNDDAFKREDGSMNRELARLCYSIRSIGTKNGMTPFEVKMFIQNHLSSADYIALKDTASSKMNYGLKLAGVTHCPICHSDSASFIALTDDRFFRPTMGDLRAWKYDRSARGNEKPARGKAKAV